MLQKIKKIAIFYNVLIIQHYKKITEKYSEKLLIFYENKPSECIMQNFIHSILS